MDFIQKIVDCDMDPMMNSNGVLFTDEIIEKLDKILGKQKMLVAISLDGFGDSQYVHLRKWKDGSDAIGAFDKIIDNALKLMKKGYKVVFNFTYTNLNKNNLFDLYYFLEKKFAGYDFTLNVILFGMSGNGSKNRDTLSVRYEDWKKELNKIMKLKLENQLCFLKIEPTCPWEIYLPLKEYSHEIIEKHLRYVTPLKSPFYRRVRDVGCHAGITNIVINWNGEVYPCGLYPVNSEMCLGDLQKNSLDEIWKNSLLLSKIRNTKLENLAIECQECDFANICGGGCRGAAIQVGTGFYGKDLRCPILSGDAI